MTMCILKKKKKKKKKKNHFNISKIKIKSFYIFQLIDIDESLI